MTKVRELNHNVESESWAFLVSPLSYQAGVMISLKDDARLVFDMPDGKTHKYYFKKGTVLLVLKNGEVVYNSRDIINVQHINE